MKSVFFYLILLIVTVLNSQETSKVDSIINSSEESIEVEKQLHLFFKTYKDSLTPNELADCYHDYATDWFYKKKKDNKTAIRYINEALLLKRKTKDSLPKTYKKSLYNLGFFYKKELKYFEAIDALEQIVELKVLDKITIKAYKELGILYSKIGDFSKALENFNKAEKHQENSAKSDIKLLTTIYLEKAKVLSTQSYTNNADNILYYLNKSDSLFRGDKISKNKLVSKQLRGNLFIETKRYEKALPHLQYIINHAAYISNYDLSMAYSNLGVVYHKINDFKTAESFYRKAIELEDNLLGFLNYGELCIDMKLYNKGVSLLQKGIARSTLERNTTDSKWLPSLEEIQRTPYKLDLLDLLIESANSWSKYYEYNKNELHLKQALKTFKLADKLIDYIRYENIEYKSKLYWREKASALYVNAVKICYYLNNTEMAFYLMEKNKALLLLEDVTNEQAKVNSNLPIAVAKREFELKSAIFLAEQQFLESKDNIEASKTVLEDAIFNKKHIYKKFVDSIDITYPKYTANKKRTKVLSGKEIIPILKTQNQVLLQYIIGEEDGYIIYGDANTMSLSPIKNVSALLTNSNQLLKLLQHPLYTTAEFSEFRELSKTVYSSLIPENIQLKLKNKHIVIVPDQTLQKLPFEILVNPNKNRYLIEDSQLSYVYSMSHLRALQILKTENTKKLLAFAPVNFKDENLPSLPLSETELQEIVAYYPNDFYIKKDATKETFIKASKDCNIIHISTHAELGNNGNPWIAFVDEKMTLNEIYATRIRADMVVLSACQTGLGDVKKGEGVMSLARGFFSAGTKSVVSTLWSVNDKANAELMSDFYKLLSEGNSRAAALHKAKLNYLNTHTGIEKSPHFWASLVLIGESSTIVTTSKLNLFIVIGFGVISLLILIYLLRNKLKQSIN